MLQDGTCQPACTEFGLGWAGGCLVGGEKREICYVGTDGQGYVEVGGNVGNVG